MASETQAALKSNAAGPKSVSADGQTTTQHSIREQIEADRYVAATKASRRKGLGLVFSRIRLGGGVSR